MLAGSALCLHGGGQAGKLPDRGLQGWDQTLETASTPQKHKMVLQKHHIGVPTADTPSSEDFGPEKEKQKAQWALGEGELWRFFCPPPSPSWPHISDLKWEGHRWSLQIKPFAHDFGCGSGGDRERTPFGKSGVGVCACGCV